jgi:hypothetical protein
MNMPPPKQPTKESATSSVALPLDVQALIRELHRIHNAYCDIVKKSFLEEEPDSHQDYNKRVEAYRAYLDVRQRTNARLAEFGLRYIYDQYKQRFIFNPLPDVTKDLS